MKKSVLKGLVLVAGSTAASSVLANEDITAAIAAGQSNVTLVVGGVIGVSALVFGIGLVTRLLGK